MKQSFHFLLTLLLSALFVYGGSGVNAYFFCCDDCRAMGSSAVTEHKCSEIHSHAHETGITDHRDGENDQQYAVGLHDSCGVERITFSWESFTRYQELQPLTIDLDETPFWANISDHHDLAKSWNLTCHHTGSHKPPNLSREGYLSLLTILLI